jgi:uncharacterized membrane protein YidH (DUF202 family)
LSDVGDEDPSDARRRTALAWQRTVLSVAGVAIVQLRLSLGRGSGPAAAVVVLAAVIAVVVLVDSRRRQREVTVHPTPGVARRASLMAASVILLLLAELGLVVFGS